MVSLCKGGANDDKGVVASSELSDGRVVVDNASAAERAPLPGAATEGSSDADKFTRALQVPVEP